MRNIHLFLYVTFGVLFLSSCKNSIPLKKNQKILWANEFKGNKNVIDEELLSLVPFSQRPNSKPLKLPITPEVWWYSIGLKTFKKDKHLSRKNKRQTKLDLIQNSSKFSSRKIQRINKKIERDSINIKEGMSWFWRNIGDSLVVVDSLKVVETSKKIQKYLMDIGFREVNVSYQLKLLEKANRVKVIYTIVENVRYKVDSVEYLAKDPAIQNILNSNKSQQQIHAGSPADLRLVVLEKNRIESVLKNNGYYGFNQRFISYGITTPNGNESEFFQAKSGYMRFEILNPSTTNSHEVFTIKKVIVKSFDPNSIRNQQENPDSVDLNGVTFLRFDNTVPIKIIGKRILTPINSIYNYSKITATQQQLSYFNQFAFASSQLKSMGGKDLALEYFAPLLQKYTLGISPGINNIYNDGTSFFGFGIPISLTTRNRLHKLETFELSARGSYEGQPSPLNTEGQSIRGSLELGLNLNLTLPTFWPSKLAKSRFLLKNPRTILGMGYSYSEPFWGLRQNFRLSANYVVQINKYTNWYFSPMDINLINTRYFKNSAGQEFYNTLVDLQEEGNNLKVTFDPQFVSSFNTNYIYNNQNLSKPFSNSRFLRLFFESGGTTLNFLRNPSQIGFVERLFPLSDPESSSDSSRSYFRFLKINIDFRTNRNINSSSSFAYRINFGLANPYGKNKSLPFDKNFFIGGSNSVRAWAPRTLGTGSSPPDTTAFGNTIPQPGDILLEGNLEYRKRMFHFLGEIQMAAFLDAGNVWKWYPIDIDTKRNTSNFEFNRFWREIALGTGLGIRWDLSYFLFRFDWGIKVIDPSRKVGERWVLDEFRFRSRERYGLTWNFGIGYPF
ncbi:MAG: BamA/TamA family outer membrane protein [Leadbetterella sp.]